MKDGWKTLNNKKKTMGLEKKCKDKRKE